VVYKVAVDFSKKTKLKTQAEERVSRPLWWVLVFLTIAAVAELLIWRTFSRVGVFIPKDEPRQVGFRNFYNISVQVGTIMLNFAVLLALLSMFLLAQRLRENGALNQKRTAGLVVGIVASALVLALSLALLILVEDVLAATLLRSSLCLAFVGFAVDYWQRNPKWQARLFISLLAWGYVVPLVAKLLHDLLPATAPVVYEPLIEAGELLVLLNGFGLFVVYGSDPKAGGPARQMLRHWPALLGAVVVVGIFLGLTFITVAESFIVPILGLYALGYTMHWPMPLYAVALFFLAYTVFYNLGEMRRDPQQKAAALGLILIFCGGYLFNISDQYLFALVGVLLLTRPEVTE